MLTVIIAEKPSLARNIVAGITENGGGTLAKKNGYFEGGGYIVTWAFGHLFSLCDIEDYTGGDVGAKWTLDNLPCFPEEFKYKLRVGADKKVDTGVERQFETIKYLCLRPDVDRIVNAGDSDREGEIIIRLCVMNTGALADPNKKFLRLWLPDQTPETVGKALAEMKDESEYQSLADEGFARTYIDWLYGVNLTRYATLKSGTLLRVGRVIVPIVRAIYDRDMAIRNFVPDVYFAAVSKEKTKDEEIELISREKFDKEKKAEAEALCRKYNASKAVVVSKKTKKETVNPGKLFSLSKLQNLLGKKYKMSMADSLAIVQKLYEEGYLTYRKEWTEDTIEADFPMAIRTQLPETWTEAVIYTDMTNLKPGCHTASATTVHHDPKDDNYIALFRGPLTLAADSRTGKEAGSVFTSEVIKGL